MSELSSYDTFDSEDETNGWLMSSESSIDDDDDLSDELTLLNGDEDSDEDSLLDDDFIRLSQRLKEKYNLREATVELERCDKIWDTMQLVKNAQRGYESNDFNRDEDEEEISSSRSISCIADGKNSFVPYIKYQPVQGNGNNALPNFYLAVKSQKKVYHCVTCGKQYNEKRSLRQHSEKDHGIILPQERPTKVGEPRNLRPKTPSEFGSRFARTDAKISHNLSRRERDNSKSRLSNSSLDTNDTFKARIKSTGLKEVDDLLGLSYACPLCDSKFSDSRSLSIHSMKFHGMTTTEAKKRINMKHEKIDIVVPKKENLNTEENRRGARYTRTSREASSSITEWLSSAAKTTNVKKEISSNNNNSRSKERTVRKTFHDKTFKIINGFKYRYMLTCKSCGKTFFAKKSFKSHLKKIHGLTIAPFAKGGWKEASKNSGIFKYEMVKIDDIKPLQSNKNSSREKYSKSPERRKSLIDRPRRACASRTSYTECSKAEEEALQKSLSGIPMSPIKNPPNQTTNCFLCKKSYVDIRKHLVDYHRINSPESVLPLTAKTEPEINDNCKIDSAKTIEIAVKPLETKKQQEVKRPWIDLENNPNAVILTGNISNRFQCVVCSYKYKYAEGLRRHLKSITVNGVVQPHDPYTGQPNLKKNKRPRQLELPLEDPSVDPLALTDPSESSKTNSVCSEDVDYQSVKRKRTISTSDERSSPSLESDPKRRKTEDFVFDNDVQNDAESRSDSAQENVERESVIELSETDRSSVEEVKSPNHRDTRDSSDRDSGIGISITIKKRNDSYEVVEKDNCEDEEKSSKNFENTKDDNLLLCSESSSDVVAPVDYVSYVNESRRYENVNSIDCSKEENILGSVRNDNGDDDGDNENKTEDTDTNNDEDNNYHWKEGCYNLEACNYMPGKVPTLKVLCRTALTTEELTMSKSKNFKYSHQCPVCCRFYPTERDVTVHMLEHKVSRTNFRTTRLHVIPSSALRRYGRRPV